MIIVRSDPVLAAVAYETAVTLQADYYHGRVAMWVLKNDAPERIRFIWFTAQATGILPRHLAGEVDGWLEPIYKSEV